MRKRLHCLAILLTLFIFIQTAHATVTSTSGPIYTFLGWSSNGTQLLIQEWTKHEMDLSGAYLAAYNYKTGEVKRLGVYGKWDWKTEKLDNTFETKVKELMQTDYMPGHTIEVNPAKPVQIASDQYISLKQTETNYSVVIAQHLPSGEQVEMEAVNLNKWLQNELQGSKLRNIRLQTIHISPNMDKAIASVTAYFTKGPDYDVESCGIFPIPLSDLSARLYNTCGYRYYLKQDYDKAISNFIQAIMMDSGYTMPVYNLACVYALTGNKIQSVKMLDRLFKLDPGFKKKALEDTDLISVKEYVEAYNRH